MDKFTRLLNLVALLQQAGEPLTFTEIRRRLRPEAYPQRDPESARRAFERDKADLLEMGMPLQVSQEPGDDGAATYSMGHRSTMLRDPGFTPEELGALHFAATAMSFRDRDEANLLDARDGLRKFGGLGGRVAHRDLAQLRLDDNLTAVFSAIVEGTAVGFTHGDRVRRLLPRQIASRGGHWYLRGLDLDADADRSYRMDRIQGPVLPLPEEPTGTRGGPGATALDGLRFRPWEFGEGDPARALVRLDAAAAAVALASDPELEVTEEDPGGTTVALAVRNQEGLWSWLLEFLDRAELLGPPELREAFRSRLVSMAHGGSAAGTSAGEAGSDG